VDVACGEDAEPVEHEAPETPVGYSSPVCSSTGDAIDRVVAAIDQLASDTREGRGPGWDGELAERIAALWQMISDLDPELARRARGYTAPADSAPSA
jgi:hypothetical protein